MKGRIGLGAGLALLVLVAAPGARAQAPPCEPQGGTAASRASRQSPYDSVSFRVGGREGKLCYSRPSARGRKVFGELVPWDQLWRTGANEPTTLHLPFAAEVAGVALAPGKYSLYTVPSTREWVVVVNASTTQGGLTRDAGQFRNEYTDEVRAQEVGRGLVASEVTPAPLERLTFRAEPTGDATVLVLEWESIRVRIPIRAAGGE